MVRGEISGGFITILVSVEPSSTSWLPVPPDTLPGFTLLQTNAEVVLDLAPRCQPAGKALGMWDLLIQLLKREF